MLSKIDVDQKKCVFMWVPGQVGTRGNEAAGRAAKEAHDKESTDDFTSFSDLKSLTAKHIHQVLQKEWDEAVIEANNLHEILPKLSDKLIILQHKERRQSSKYITYWSFLFDSFLSFEKRRAFYLCCM